jgi:hypothetical protein
VQRSLKQAGLFMIHFHICWSESRLDWEAFQTKQEAITQAKELKRPGETYLIQQFDDNCSRCNQLRDDPSSSLHLEDNTLSES